MSCLVSLFMIIIFLGLDEDFAEAVDEEFYNSYKTWKDDNSHDTINQKVKGNA